MTRWNKDEFFAWCGLLPKDPKPIEETPEAVPEEAPEAKPEAPAEEIAPEIPEPIQEAQSQRAIPTTGNMVFEGIAEDILETVRTLLSGANVHISITWDVL